MLIALKGKPQKIPRGGNQFPENLKPKTQKQLCQSRDSNYPVGQPILPPN
jgi:hypothetical protein